jgi:hypothetical protein
MHGDKRFGSKNAISILDQSHPEVREIKK